MPRLTIMQAVQQVGTVQPIFPNDAEGWLRLALALSGVLTIIGTGYYRIHIKPLRDTLSQMQDRQSPLFVARNSDLTALGAKVDRMENDDARVETRLTDVERLARDHDHEVRQMREAVGEVRSWMETVSRETLTMKQEIIGAVSERFDKVTRQVTDVQVSIARFEENQKHVAREVEKVHAELDEHLRTSREK
jgi:archaellum component FlaC